MGDLLLQHFGVRLNTCLRDGDSVARIGGDEFVVLLEALSVFEKEAVLQTTVVAEKIQAALGLPYSLGGLDHESTASMGIVVFSGDSQTPDEVLKKSDVAMYQAKNAGRNTFSFFEQGCSPRK
jgi:diguanylate cyclase (GGDEF)-like protein